MLHNLCHIAMLRYPSSLDIADAGYKAYVVEKQCTVGGHLRGLSTTFPTLESVPSLLAEVVERVESHPHIEVLTDSQVASVDGFIGNFHVQVERDASDSDAPTTSEHIVGAIVVATGFDTFDAARKPEFGYGLYENVITGLELEKLLLVEEGNRHSPPGTDREDGRKGPDVHDVAPGSQRCQGICTRKSLRPHMDEAMAGITKAEDLVGLESFLEVVDDLLPLR